MTDMTDALGERWRAAFETAQIVLGEMSYGYGVRGGDAPDGFWECVFLPSLLAAMDTDDLPTVKAKAQEFAGEAWSSEACRSRGTRQLFEQSMLFSWVLAPTDVPREATALSLGVAVKLVGRIGIEAGLLAAQFGLSDPPPPKAWRGAFEQTFHAALNGIIMGERFERRFVHKIWLSGVEALEPYISPSVFAQLIADASPRGLSRSGKIVSAVVVVAASIALGSTLYFVAT